MINKNIEGRKSLSRRDFLKLTGATGAILLASGCMPATPEIPTPSSPTLSPTLPPITIVPPATPMHDPSQSPQDALRTGRLIIPNTMGVNAHFLGDRTDAGEVEAFIDGGFGFLRVDFTWSQVERSPGTYDFQKYLDYISRFSSLGICSLLILDYGNPLYDDGNPPISDEARLAFAKYLKVVAGAFKDKKVIWEVWNEPDQKGFWLTPDPVEYNRFVRLVVDTLRGIDPQSLIVAPAISNLKDIDSLMFIQELGKQRTIQTLDAISVHPYRYVFPEQSTQDCLHVRSLIDSYSPERTIPLLWGESGYNEKEVGEERQAALAIRQYLFSLTQDAPLTNWYSWRDYESSAQTGSFYGMMRPNLQPKLAYYASQFMANHLDEFEFLRALPVDSDDDYLLLFEKDGQSALVVWTTGQTHSIKIDLSNTLPEITGMFGDARPQDEATYPLLSISTMPVFLKFPGSTSRSPITWKPLGNVQSINIEKPEIRLFINNGAGQPIKVEFKLSSNWLQGVADFELDPGEKEYRVPVNILAYPPAATKGVVHISQGSESVESCQVWLSPFVSKNLN